MTPRPSPSEEAREFARLLSIYGAARARWPEDRRDLFDAFADTPTGEAARMEAARLDEVLSLSKAPQADDHLRQRLLASFETRRKPAAVAWRSPLIRTRLIPAGALAALSALGFVVGSATAEPRDQAIYYANAAIEGEVVVEAFLMDDAP